MRKIIQSVFLISISTALFTQTWVENSPIFEGDNADDQFGRAISMNQDGSVVAIGTGFNDGNGTSSGQVKVFEKQSNTWIQKGADFYGFEADLRFGDAVSLNATGNIIAIGSPNADPLLMPSNTGFVQVYEFTGGNWVQLGDDINGEAGNDFSGGLGAVSISADGYTVAIGSSANDGNGISAGHVRVYRYSGGVWGQIGADIDGQAGSERFGVSVSVSATGDTVVAGGTGKNGTYLSQGVVRAYVYDGLNWTQLGGDMDGAGDFYQFGSSVAISKDGKTVIGGAKSANANGNSSGQAKVFRLIAGNWVQIGQDLNGVNSGDQFGYSVAINADGSRVFVGSYTYDGVQGSNTGAVIAYELNAGNWIQLANIVEGKNTDDVLGWATATNNDGTAFFSSAPSYDGLTSNAGSVQLFRLCSPTVSSITVSNCVSYVSPSGKTFTNSSTFNDTIVNAQGCDSVITINLTIYQPSDTAILVQECVGYVSPNGKTWNTPGGYIDTITESNKYGCDSIITVYLTIRGSYVTVNDTACDSYIRPSGFLATSSGQYFDTLTNQFGCDSVIETNLIINQTTYGNLTVSSCNSYMSPSGNIWTSSGLYTDVIQNEAGCDSIIDINLTILSSSTSTRSISTCNSYTAPSGTIFNATGIHYDTIPNQAGCDSIIEINLTILPATYSQETIASCEDYTTPSGKVLSTSGIVYDTIPNQAGCDSIITINFTRNFASTTTMSDTGCSAYTLPDGSIINTSGMYYDTLIGSNTCDSIIIYDITILSIDTSITINGYTLEAISQPNATYQWLDCNSNLPIAGATNNTFTPQVGGNFAVEISIGNCLDTTSCVFLSPLSVNDLSTTSILSVYPNPTTDVVYIKSSNLFSPLTIQQINMKGQTIKSIKSQNNDQDLPFELSGNKGVYIIKVFNEELSQTFRIIKN